jgi:uncharacterized protein YqeY
VSLKQQLEDDLKQAMLAGDKTLVTTLRGLKSAILNVEVAKGVREAGLPDNEVIDVLTKQAKQRQESADLFTQGGNAEKAAAELAEKVVIEKYLPAQASEEEITTAVDKVIADTGAQGMQAMGQVIGAVKQQFGASADGSVVARIVKERLS